MGRCILAEVFRIDVENLIGVTVTSLKNFQYFSYGQRVSNKGNFRLQLHDDDPNRLLIHEDYIIKLWYKNESQGIDWTNIFTGIVKTPTRVWYSNGNKLAIFYGADSNELVAKALILYKTSAIESAKSDTSSNVIAEYIEENIGASALIANGRYFDHVNPVTIINLSSVGPVWTGNKANDNLMKTLQDIRSFSIDQVDRVDWQVYYTENYTWEVRVGKIYEDKTTIGLSSATGLNGAGNVPVILSPLYGNVKQYTESLPRSQESNVVVVLGKRIGDDREVAVASDATSIAVSPIAQRESIAQTQNQEDLVDFAQSQLNDRVGKPVILMSPKITPAFSLYRDLNIGDFFTAVSLDQEEFNKQLIEIKVVIQQTKGGRTISQYTIFTEDNQP